MQSRHTRAIVTLILTLIFICNILFVIPLAGSGFYLYRSLIRLQENDYVKASNSLRLSDTLYSAAKILYWIPTPILYITTLKPYVDRYIEMIAHANSLSHTALDTVEDGKQVLSLVVKKDKSPKEKEDIVSRVKRIQEHAVKAESDIDFLTTHINLKIEKLQSTQAQLVRFNKILHKFNTSNLNINQLLGQDTEQRYLLFFLNNKEIRPGGGFIGSFGILTFADYTLKELRVEDVYDADGQLKIHVEPPTVIRKYLQIPNWFLRDSNFSPDFPENLVKAKYFLDNELKLGEFDGAIGITTTAFQYFLEAYGDIYLADEQEPINKDNFYLKTQTKVEKDFFAGSKQKKTVLSALAQSMIQDLSGVSVAKLGLQLKKGLDEKQIVLYSYDKVLQDLFESQNWAGELQDYNCDTGDIPCFANVFFPVEANIGANKANYFISRSTNVVSNINDDGTIESELILKYRNDSPSETLPAGVYKNYMQLYTPLDSTLESLTYNGEDIEDFTVGNHKNYKVYSFTFEVPIKTTGVLQAIYTLNKAAFSGKNIYRLFIPKQTGYDTSDFIMNINLPYKASLIDQNVNAIVHNNTVIYKTQQNGDIMYQMTFNK